MKFSLHDTTDDVINTTKYSNIKSSKLSELRKLLSIDCWCEINVMALSFKFRFFGTFCGKMGVAATSSPKGLGPQNPTKQLAHVGSF